MKETRQSPEHFVHISLPGIKYKTQYTNTTLIIIKITKNIVMIYLGFRRNSYVLIIILALF